MNAFFLYLPINGTLIACFLGLAVGILFFGHQLHQQGYKTKYSTRWIAIFVLTFIVSIPNEFLVSASDNSIKKAIDCINLTENVRLRAYMKLELDRNNVRQYKIDRVYRQCLNDKSDTENFQKRQTQSKTLF